MCVSSGFGRGRCCAALLAAALLGWSDTPVRCQSPAETSAPSTSRENDPRPATPQQQPVQRGTPPSATQPQPDLEAIRKMIREELIAEQNKKDEEERKKKAEEEKNKAEQEKKKAEAQWFEVGKDLKLGSFMSNGFVAETADKAFRFHFGGRLEYDNAWLTQDHNLLIGPDPTTRFQDGSDFRRARLRADGAVWEFIQFAAEVSFATIQDVANVNNESVPVGSVSLTEFDLTFRNVPLAGNL